MLSVLTAAGPAQDRPEAMNATAAIDLLLELCGAPADRRRNTLGGNDLAEFPAEFGVGRVERADCVEPGVKRGAKPGGVGAAVDRALCRVQRLG